MDGPPGDGLLSHAELGGLVRRFLPNVSEGALRYFEVMIDTNGDGKVSYKEFVRALKESRKAHVALRVKSGLEVTDLLRRLRMHMASTAADVPRVFQRFDTDQSGLLDHREVRARPPRWRGAPFHGRAEARPLPRSSLGDSRDVAPSSVPPVGPASGRNASSLASLRPLPFLGCSRELPRALPPRPRPRPRRWRRWSRRSCPP